MATVPERTPGQLIGLNMNQASGGSGGHRGPEKDAFVRADMPGTCGKMLLEVEGSAFFFRNPKFTLEGS